MNLLSPRKDPYAHLRDRVARVASPAFEGGWSTIEIQPDVFARQRYTVGVAVCDAQGIFAFRLLDDFSAFDCIYRASEVAAIRTLVDSAEQSLLRAKREAVPLDRIAFDTDGVLIGQVWATAGNSADEVLSRLFVDVIPFLPRSDAKEKTFLALDTAAVRARVSDALKHIAGLSFERVVTDSRLILDRDTGITHRLDLNLAPPDKVGSVISAVYKTQSIIELNYFHAATDLATFRSLQGEHVQPGIFVMQPEEGSMPSEDLARVEGFLDEQNWRLEKQGFVVVTHDNAADLAQEIWEWSGLAA